MRGVQHLEAVRLRVREQKELLAGTNKELKRLRKTLKTYEVHYDNHMHTKLSMTAWIMPLSCHDCSASMHHSCNSLCEPLSTC